MDFSYVPCEHKKVIFIFFLIFFLKSDSFFHWLLLDTSKLLQSLSPSL